MSRRPPKSHARPAPVDETDWRDVLARDPAALERLCRRWHPVVLQWCRRLGGPRVDAEGAAQDVMVLFLERLDRVRGAEVVSAYLFGLTRRELARHRRKAWVSRWMPGVVAEPVSPRSDPEAAAASSAMVHALREIVADLPEELASVWVLCEVEGRTMPEVVAMVGTPEGTLRTRLRKARSLVRQRAAHRGLLDEESR